MKKLLLLLLILPMMGFNTIRTNEDFVGKWTGEIENQIVFLTFDIEGYASFEIDGRTMGGKEFDINGEKGKMVYTINRDVDPIEVDLTMTKIESGEERFMLCIAKFEDKDTMQFAMGQDDVRPVDFEGDQMILLKRVK